MSDAEFFEKAIKEKLCLLKDILLKDESSCDPKIIFQEVFMVVFQKLYKIAYFLEYRLKKVLSAASAVYYFEIPTFFVAN